MKRAPRLTKRERKAQNPGPRPPQQHQHQHIHCVACGVHLDAAQFQAPATAQWLTCDHGSRFAACTACAARAKELLAEHDRTGQPVQAASAWH